MTIHPKTSGAAVGSALGVLIVAVLNSIHGVHLAPELPGAITGFLAMFGAWLVPANPVTPVTSNDTTIARVAALNARERAIAEREAAITHAQSKTPPHS